MIHVTDAYPVNEFETILVPANVLKKERSGWTYKTEKSGQKTTLWVECIPENATFQFDISFDNKLLSEFKKQNKISLPQSIKEVLNDINIWSHDILTFESEFSSTHDLSEWYNNNSPNFRIGFGSGMTSTTIAILLDEELRKMIRNLSGKDKGSDIAPKSRRVWIKNNQPIPLGWAVLEIAD
jgi:CRISPR-associated protein Csm5